MIDRQRLAEFEAKRADDLQQWRELHALKVIALVVWILAIISVIIAVIIIPAI